MPELPEVETMVRGIRPAVEGRTIVRVERVRCACRPLTLRPPWRTLKRQLEGRRVERVRRAGKRIVWDLDDGCALVIEPRMTGLVVLDDPPDTAHLRLKFELESTPQGTRTRVWFWDRRGLGTVSLLDAHELSRTLGPGRLGPDALRLTADDWQRICHGRRQAIKTLLMDQRKVAGIGNLYASEILHEARIHPCTPAGVLKRRQLRRLADAVRRVLQEAIEHEGSTLGDGTYRTALNAPGRYQNLHRVYGRAGERCAHCRRGRIRRIVQAQRATFYCPVCQRPPRSAAGVSLP
ncbi:MAG: bifunctional DNA-formamidopyrimidine glycosylase/DNA-(apurinic or apyrimidinic site) lyase [Planctomycetota bacterium]|nr:MAG: bifunctional DNA-formamidopyrimidine glycosylase/DNA-(apurinic or apyrimidinic site) lyase [Planctomycetota bacterium]